MPLHGDIRKKCLMTCVRPHFTDLKFYLSLCQVSNTNYCLPEISKGFGSELQCLLVKALNLTDSQTHVFYLECNRPFNHVIVLRAFDARFLHFLHILNIATTEGWSFFVLRQRNSIQMKMQRKRDGTSGTWRVPPRA